MIMISLAVRASRQGCYSCCLFRQQASKSGPNSGHGPGANPSPIKLVSARRGPGAVGAEHNKGRTRKRQEVQLLIFFTRHSRRLRGPSCPPGAAPSPRPRRRWTRRLQHEFQRAWTPQQSLVSDRRRTRTIPRWERGVCLGVARFTAVQPSGRCVSRALETPSGGESTAVPPPTRRCSS